MNAASTSSSLINIGQDLERSFVAVSIETFLIAIYALTVFKAISILYGKKKSYTVTVQLAIVILLFFLALVEWIIDCVNVVGEARITLINDPDGDLSSKHSDALEFIFRRNAIQAMLYAYMSLVGDAVVIWRVHAVWSIERFSLLVFIPVAMLLGSFTVTIMLTFCVAQLGSEIILGTFQKPAFCRNIQTASYGTAVATTLFATILIGLKAWRYHQTNKLLFSRRYRKRKLVALVESGVLYLLFFLAQMLISISPVNVAIAEHNGAVFALTIFDDIASIIVGIYPTIIIILVNSEQASSDSSDASTSMENSRSLNVSFSRMVVNDGQSDKAEIHLGDFRSYLGPSSPTLQKSGSRTIKLSV